ncbi:MAG: SDR family NAD(P)-dependent oxidoreductase [Verrucomicrobia bacterium]|jgi:NAD(P)-dependent dehydrogenase (short-subunit alcohol dehydrogenase family)|nr:SDR family NAD(P)-dependent oxidoreductase [Verrucomicrobiota bacterium]
MTTEEKGPIFLSGVSRGLGHGLAQWYLERGRTLYGCSRSDPPSDLVERYGDRFHWAAIDLSDEVEGPRALQAFCGQVPSWDLLILNAGVLGTIADMREADLAEMRSTMEINLWANKWILDELLSAPDGVRQVVGISSGASVSGSRGWNGYSLSKAALNMLIKLYAAEFPDTHFSAFAPGLIDTAMQEYISSIEDDAPFSTVRRLKAARGTADMPDPGAAAEAIAPVLAQLPSSVQSGDYADIRSM